MLSVNVGYKCEYLELVQNSPSLCQKSVFVSVASVPSSVSLKPHFGQTLVTTSSILPTSSPQPSTSVLPPPIQLISRLSLFDHQPDLCAHRHTQTHTRSRNREASVTAPLFLLCPHTTITTPQRFSLRLSVL